METEKPRTEKQAAVSREEWAKRVERWKESGLTAEEFSAEVGINARTLIYWKYQLGREARGGKRVWSGKRGSGKAASERGSGVAEPSAQGFLVEVQSTAINGSFELELGRGRVLRIPQGFDIEGLRRLLAALEAS